MQRAVRPEILDSLPPEDAGAKASRRDLWRINALQGNYRWIARNLPRIGAEGLRVLELGAGSGQISSLLRPADHPGLSWTGLDLAPRPEGWPAEWDWQQGDVFALAWPAAEVLVANLFLHHFDKETLSELGRKIPASVRTCLFCETHRRSWHFFQARLLALAGVHAVTRHDACASIVAGFQGDELENWLRVDGWRWERESTFFGAYRLKGWR